MVTPKVTEVIGLQRLVSPVLRETESRLPSVVERELGRSYRGRSPASDGTI